MVGHNEKEKETVRKLRVEEKKSFGEIARLTGIAKTTIIDWAKKEGWPSPQKERKALAKIINIDNYKTKPAKAIKKVEVSKSSNASIDGIDFESKPQKLAQQLFKWSAQVMLNAAKYSLPAAKAIMDTSAKMITAFKNDNTDEKRQLTIYIPPVTEVYDDPPAEDTNRNDNISD